MIMNLATKKNIENKEYLYISLFFAFIYTIILGLQGFDLCDEGLELTSFQQIFNAPSSVEYNFLLYLTAFIGGLWNFIFGFGGIVSFRILSVIIIVLTIYFTYLTTKKFLEPKMIPIATVFALLLVCSNGLLVFHHNYLTFLLISIGVYFILNGLNTNSYLKLFFGFFFIGINVFSRLPNITMISLGLLIFVDYFYRKDIKILGKNFLYGTLGVVGGIATILLLMKICGHLEIFKEAIADNLLTMGGSNEDTHSLTNIILTFIRNYIEIYTYLAIFIFTTVFFVLLYRFSQKKWIKILCIIGFSILISFFVLRNIGGQRYYSVILFPLIASFFYDYKNKFIILLNSASLIIMIFLPLGSSHGVGNMGTSSIWLATFVSVGHIYRYIQYQKNKRSNNAYLVFGWCFFILYVIFGLFSVSSYAYFDSGSRLQKRFRADNDKFTVYTSKEKVDVINELLSELNKYVKKDDYLLAFESLATIHYLTETRPYLGAAWPWMYDSELFKYHLEKSINNKIPLPVVLRQKCQPIGGYWTIPVTETPEKDDFYYKKNRVKYLENFLLENNYKLVWENDLFSIYIP